MKPLKRTFCTVAIIVALFESVASAHPQDTDSFALLPPGTEMVSKTLVNLKPGLSNLYFSSGQIFTDLASLPSGQSYCRLTVEISSFDRELTPEKSVLVTTGSPSIVPSSQDIAFSYDDPSMFIFFNQENSPYKNSFNDPTMQESDRYLSCVNPNGKIAPNSYDISLSIGDVKKILGSYFEIRLPQPKTLM